MAQLAFDPTKNEEDQKIDPAHFTGLVINADWNENILRSWRFLDGKLVNFFNPDAKKKGGRPQECITYYTQYTTVTGVSCGNSCIDVTFTVHTVPNTYCYDSGYTGSDQGGYTGSGGYSGNGQAGGGYTPPNTPNYSPYQYYPINDLMKIANSEARQTFLSRAQQGLFATGMANDLTGWNLDIASTIAKYLKIEFEVAFPIIEKVGTRIGIMGVVISGCQAYVGFAQDGWQWNQDGWNVAQVALGIGGVVAGALALPEIAVATGVISLGIAIGTTISN